MPRAALVFALVVLAVVTLVAFVPFLDRERAVPVSTPSSPSLFVTPALVEVPPGQRACLDDVALIPEADIARFRVGTYGFDGPPLLFTLSGPGYREQVRVPRGYPDSVDVVVPVQGPRQELMGKACIKNGGRRLIALYATTEGRTQSRVDVEVAGEPVAPDVALAFYEREPSTIVARTPEILEVMTAFRPVGTWLTWPLLVLVLIGVPALGLWALHGAFRADGRGQPNAATSRRASPISRG